MTETDLVDKFLKVARAEMPTMALERMLPGPVILKHADGMTSGMPDVSVDFHRLTSWWEFKHGPKIKWAHALQQLTCQRLDRATFCRVVLYEEKEVDDRIMKRTVILTPDEVEVEAVDGFNHRFVLDVVWRTHAAARTVAAIA